MSMTKIKSALKTAKSFKMGNDAEFKLFYKYIKNAMDRIIKNPVEIGKNNDKVSEVIIFEHYKVKADKNNSLQLLIDFSAEPSDNFNAIDPIYVQRDTDLVEVSSNYDRGEVRHPRQNWLFDIQPSKEKKDEEDNYGEDDDSYKKNYTPYLTRGNTYHEKLNYKSLLFFIKTCAYFGVLEHLNNETIFMLAKHNSDMDFKGKYIEADASDESKKLVQCLILVREAILISRPEILNSCFDIKGYATDKTEKTHKLIVTTINKKISDSLLSIMHEKQVLIYLDNIYDHSNLINYLIAVNNIEKYRTGFELFKNESENLVNYIVNFEPNLEGLNDKKHFSFDNKVTDWSRYHLDLTFPQAKSMKNFKAFSQGNITVQKCLFEYIGMHFNSELMKGIKEKTKIRMNQQETNENLNNNWTYLIAWLTYGETWKNCTENDIMCFGRIIEHCDYFELSKKLINENGSKNYSEEFAKATDLLIKISRKSDKAFSDAVDDEKEEENNENMRLALNLMNKENEVFDFITGSHIDKKGKETPNISLITNKTTEKSLTNKCDKWHKEQVLINKVKKLNIQNPKEYDHLNQAVVEFDGVTLTVLSSDMMVIRESIEMRHCLGVDYKELIENGRYVAVHGEVKNHKFTLGLVLRYTMGQNRTPYFVFNQCVGVGNTPVKQEVLMKCRMFVDHINKTPQIILKNKSA